MKAKLPTARLTPVKLSRDKTIVAVRLLVKLPTARLPVAVERKLWRDERIIAVRLFKAKAKLPSTKLSRGKKS